MQEMIDFELVHSQEEGLKKNAVLLFHGLTGSPFEMKKYGTFLYKLGYDVFCYSFPGHGEKLDEILQVSWQDWVNSSIEKYKHLRPDYDKFYLSGLCLGAAVSLYLAQKFDNVSGIILLSTTLYLDGFCMPKRRWMLPIATNTIFRYFYTFPEDESMGIKNERTRKTLAKIMSKTTVGMDNYPLTCVRELLELSKVVRKNLKQVTTPALIIHSQLDNLTSVKGAKEVYNKISSEIKEYIELKYSYHMVLYDNEKQFVMETVKKFLTKMSDDDLNLGVIK